MRNDAYRTKQVLIVATVSISLGLILGACALWLKPVFAMLTFLLGLYGAALFGMCTWYASAWDKEAEK